jgi:hypothetical protein
VACADSIFYGIPDLFGRFRERHAGGQEEPGTASVWATRSTDLIRIYGGVDLDQLPARGELGVYVRKLVDSGRVILITGFGTSAIRQVSGRLLVDVEAADGFRSIGPVDQIIAATGQRADISLIRELRLELDPWFESTKALGLLLDPNIHSCGSVPPHGYRELNHPEPGFYTVGIKSYGRAPTFLLQTGYEQVRSVAAVLAGDMTGAETVQPVLPETGVCTTPSLPESGLSRYCKRSNPFATDVSRLTDLTQMVLDRGSEMPAQPLDGNH